MFPMLTTIFVLLSFYNLPLMESAPPPNPPPTTKPPVTLKPVAKTAPVPPKPAPVPPKPPPPVTPKPAPVTPKPAPVIPKPAPVTPKPTPAPPKPAAVPPKPAPAPPKPAPAPPKPAPPPPKPAPAPPKPAPPPPKPAPAPPKPAPAPPKPAPAPPKPAPAPPKPAPAPAKPAPPPPKSAPPPPKPAPAPPKPAPPPPKPAPPKPAPLPPTPAQVPPRQPDRPQFNYPPPSPPSLVNGPQQYYPPNPPPEQYAPPAQMSPPEQYYAPPAQMPPAPNYDIPQMPPRFSYPSSEPQEHDGPYSEQGEPWIQQGVTSASRQVINSCECGTRNEAQMGRIINGYNTHNNEYPWQTYLMAVENRQTVIINGRSSVNFNFKSCGGSIINDFYILSAAHCLVDERPGYLRKVKTDILGKIMLKNTNDPNAKEISFDKIIVHPGYLAYIPQQSGASVVSNLYDIALLKLSERLPLDWSPYLKPVCLPETNDNINIQEGLTAKLMGWGLTSRGHGASASENLLQVNFAMHNASTCDKYSGGDASRFVCGEDLYSDTGSAQGDSGGPLCIQMGDNPNKLLQIGVVSFTNKGQFTMGDQVTESYSLGYYSSVMSFLPFIDYYSSGAGARWCQRT